jgi:hypothetical protein
MHTYSPSVANLEGSDKFWVELKDSIKTDLAETGCEGVT